MSFLNKVFGVEGKVAVVIGGTGVLCGQMAQGLAQAGAKVVLVGRNAEKGAAAKAAIQAIGGQAEFVAADATDRSQINAILPAALDHFGRVDILINGAGVNSATPVLEIDDEEFDRIINANLRGVLAACQSFAKHWLALKERDPSSGGGSVINIGSVSGIRPLSRVFTYAMSKAAVHNLTANLSHEWSAKGIRVNTLVPGFFPAEQNRKILTQERVDSIMRHTPMKRFGEPQELVGATLLLASDAGSFITGTEIVVDGGFSGITI